MFKRAENTHKYIILVVLSQHCEKVHVTEQLFTRSPVVKDLLSRTRWIVYLLWLDISHNTHSRHNKFHSGWWIFHGFHDWYICGLIKKYISGNCCWVRALVNLSIYLRMKYESWLYHWIRTVKMKETVFFINLWKPHKVNKQELVSNQIDIILLVQSLSEKLIASDSSGFR